ncbi:MAG: LemA protein [Gaiellales bacterium]|nr:LemA protein [Gaiellales bacterium]
MRRFLRAAVVVLGSLPATASAGLELGLQDDAYLSSADPRAWQLTRELRPDVIRYNVDWSSIARRKPDQPESPGDPAYDWASTDGIVQGAARQGARALLTIVQAPAWANGGGAPRAAPLRAADYGTFCKAVASRYSGSFSSPGAAAPLPRVTSFTVWNEPNRGQFLTPQGPHGFQAPKVLARLMAACTTAIHSVSPSAQVALGPLASRGGQGGIAPIAFLARYRAAGGPRPDVVALNPYLGSLLPEYRGDEKEDHGAVTIRNLDRLESSLTAAYGDAVPIWLTEFAWRTAPQPGLGVITPARQAELAEQSVDVVRAHYPYAQMLVWFLLRDESPTSYWRSGLVTYHNQKKPVFAVWGRLARVSDADTVPSRSMLALWIAIAVVVIVLLWLVFGYNRLVRLRNEAEQGFSGIDVQLKRRADLIPNLVETVKAYAAHESGVFERVAEARAQSLAARGVGPAAAAAGLMTSALTGLFGVAEAYPELRASENFQRLQAELSDTEDKIAAARRYYNTTVRRFNSLIQSVPTNIIARTGGFREREFFRIEDDADRAPVAVDLS